MPIWDPDLDTTFAYRTPRADRQDISLLRVATNPADETLASLGSENVAELGDSEEDESEG